MLTRFLLLLLLSLGFSTSVFALDSSTRLLIESLATPLYQENKYPQNYDQAVARSDLIRMANAVRMYHPSPTDQAAYSLLVKRMISCGVALDTIDVADGKTPSALAMFGEAVQAGYEEDSQKDLNWSKQSYDKRLKLLGSLTERAKHEFIDKPRLIRDYATAHMKLVWAIGDFEPCVARQSGPSGEEPVGIKWEYLPSWEGSYKYDDVNMTNASGRNLKDVTVVVRVWDSSTTAFRHIHYIRSWPQGEKLCGRYAYHANGYKRGETTGAPKKVQVTVYTPERTSTSTKTTSHEDLESYYRAYSRNFDLTCGYRDNEPGFFSEWNRGVNLKFTGIPRLPVDRITIFFSDGSREKSLYWDRSGYMDSGKTYTYTSPRFDFDPTSIRVRLGVRQASFDLGESFTVSQR